MLLLSISLKEQAAALLGDIVDDEVDFFGVVEDRRLKLPGVRATLLCRKSRGEFQVFISVLFPRFCFTKVQGIQVLSVDLHLLEGSDGPDRREPPCLSPTSSEDVVEDGQAVLIKKEV